MFLYPNCISYCGLATGWGGGIFCWVGEGLGRGWALTCLLILWFQTMINFGMGMPSFAAPIMFYIPNYDAAVKFAQHPQHEILIMTCFIILYWILTFIATKGVKAFSNITKYGVIIGTLIPLVLMIVLTAVWLVEGHKPAILMTPKGLIPKWNGMSTLALAAGVFFSYTGIDMNAAHIKQLRKPEKDFPKAMFISMTLAFIIFVVGTVIIAMIVPEKQINVIYTLNTGFHVLGSMIGIPWLYMILVWAGLCNLLVNVITNMAGPSFMLGQAGGSGFLPNWFQQKNKHL
nr:APC family permease [Lactobacillus crispatus]